MPSRKPESPDRPATRAQAATPSKVPARAEQSDRLAAALRDNLKRRKAQARARREPGEGSSED
jgi:hypothetical protein